jgi:hypothetical protein
VSRTSHAHELVRTYLKELDVAPRGAPAVKARELKEQITAHLDDALPPDADRAEIGKVPGSRVTSGLDRRRRDRGPGRDGDVLSDPLKGARLAAVRR